MNTIEMKNEKRIACRVLIQTTVGARTGRRILKMAWAIGKSVHRTERPDSAHEWAEPELTKTASMAFL